MVTEPREGETASQDRYHIDLEWFHQNNRSFQVLATSRLCPSAHKKKSPVSESDLIKTLSQCCAKSEGFINQDMPLLEAVFRIVLANANRPVTLEQIQEKLREVLGDSTVARDISLPRLKRMIDKDRYYGLRPVPEETE